MRRRIHIKDEWREYRLFQNRAILGGIVVVVLFFVLLARLYWLQIERFGHYATLSENNRVRIQTIAPNRGLIYDRNGILLAENVPNYQLELIPEQVEDMDATLERLAEVITLREADLERFRKLLATKRSFEPVPLRYNLNEAEVAAFAVRRQAFPGVEIQARLMRRYPLGPIMAHVVGYIGSITERELQARDPARYSGTSQIGKTGIERAYEDQLHGYPGVRQVETNAQSRVLRVLDVDPPTPGHDLILNIDARLQKAAFDALGDFKGAVVALDPRNGEVLAMVSKPSFNPNLFVEGVSAEIFNEWNTSIRRPLFNRAINGEYPPGSTVKPMLGLAGLYYGVVTTTHRVYCPGYFILEGNPRPYRDWKHSGHGWTDMEKAIIESCDVYYYKLAVEMGIDRIANFLALFNLGEPTGVDLIGEESGILPSREWKRRERNMVWFPGETVNIGIGQGFMLMTPMQLAQMTARIAMRGQAFLPHVVNSIHDPLTHDIEQLPVVELPSIELGHEWPWEFVINAMEDVVHSLHGTASSMRQGLEYRVAGKTGTAQVFTLGAEEEYNEEELAIALRDHGLFIAFAPADDPRIAVAVVVENGGGSSAAIPVARAVLDTWLLNDSNASGDTTEGPP